MSSSEIPHISGKSSYDIQCHPMMPQCHHSLICGNVYTCTWYAEWIPLLRAETLKETLSSSLCRVGNCGPHLHTMTLSPRYLDAPLHQSSWDAIYYKHIKNIMIVGMYKEQLKWMVNIFKTWVCKIDLKHHQLLMQHYLWDSLLVFEQTSHSSHSSVIKLINTIHIQEI